LTSNVSFRTKTNESIIGIETARALVHANAHVVMFCRNVDAAEELKKKLLTEKVY
jgi:NADP-dependent 3-hydroxy acid dehydrogenase YdfG